MNVLDAPIAKRSLTTAAILGLMVTGCVHMRSTSEPAAVYFNGKIVTLDASGSTADSDEGIFMPEEAVSVTEALKMWTVWAAKSMGQSNVKGSIEPGKYADMTVLSDDIFTMPKEDLKKVKVLKTIVDGTIVYETE